MNRRDLFKNSLAISALALGARRVSASPRPAAEFPKAPGLTKSVAEFIVNTKYADIPQDVIDLGKKSILDGFGLALAGSVSVMAPLVRQYVKALGSAEEKASIIGTGMKSHSRYAAFANGVSIHADDFDDTQLAAAKDRIYGLLTHPSVAVLPPAFALCELGRRSGRDLMLAYHVGVEVECKIAEAISPRHYDEGFHTTGTCGSFGSAAACTKLRGLSAMQTTYALGIAATEGGGFRDNFGSMTKPFHAGHAAENGTVAADLAHRCRSRDRSVLRSDLGSAAPVPRHDRRRPGRAWRASDPAAEPLGRQPGHQAPDRGHHPLPPGWCRRWPAVGRRHPRGAGRRGGLWNGCRERDGHRPASVGSPRSLDRRPAGRRASQRGRAAQRLLHLHRRRSRSD